MFLFWQVDERVVLKYFDWLEGKVDVMCEVFFEFQDLMKLLVEVFYFEDRFEILCDKVLQKFLVILEK